MFLLKEGRIVSGGTTEGETDVGPFEALPGAIVFGAPFCCSHRTVFPPKGPSRLRNFTVPLVGIYGATLTHITVQRTAIGP